MTPASPWKLTTESLPPGTAARVRRPPAPIENKTKRRVASPEDRARIITLCNQGSTYAEVGVVVGMSSDGVGKIYRRPAHEATQLGWRERRIIRHTTDARRIGRSKMFTNASAREIITSLINNGASLRSVADEIGCSRTVIRNRAAEWGLSWSSKAGARPRKPA